MINASKAFDNTLAPSRDADEASVSGLPKGLLSLGPDEVAEAADDDEEPLPLADAAVVFDDFAEDVCDDDAVLVDDEDFVDATLPAVELDLALDWAPSPIWLLSKSKTV